MRQIQRLRIDKVTGDATLTVIEVPDDDAGTAERFRQLKADLPTATPESVRTAYVRCDGCERIAEVNFDQPELPAGWTATPNGDFCPHCQREN